MDGWLCWFMDGRKKTKKDGWMDKWKNESVNQSPDRPTNQSIGQSKTIKRDGQMQANTAMVEINRLKWDWGWDTFPTPSANNFISSIQVNFLLVLASDMRKLSCWKEVGRCGEMRGDLRRGEEIWGDLRRCGEKWGDVGWGEEMWGDVRRFEERWGDVGRCEEIWGEVRRCGEMWGDVGWGEEMWGDVRRFEERWGDVGRCEEIWGEVRRCGERWGGMGRICWLGNDLVNCNYKFFTIFFIIFLLLINSNLKNLIN